MATTQELIDSETTMLAALDLGTEYSFPRIVVFDADNLKLGEFAMSFPAFPTPTDTQTDANAVQDGIAASGGIPDHFEVRDRNDQVQISGTIGDTGSGADLEMDPVAAVSASQAMHVADLVWTQTDVGVGGLTGTLALLTRRAVTPAGMPSVRQIQYEDLVRQAMGPREWADRDVYLEYAFGGRVQSLFFRRGQSYTPS